jgi:hypothetical protein
MCGAPAEVLSVDKLTEKEKLALIGIKLGFTIKENRLAVKDLRAAGWSEVRIQASLFAAGHRQPKVSHILSK